LSSRDILKLIIMQNINSKIAGTSLLIILLVLSNLTPVFSCSTPVFRYALERWPAYPYIVEIIHDNNLNTSQRQALDFLKKSADSDIPANIKVVETQAGNSTDLEKEKLPLVRLYFPSEYRIKDMLWQGELTPENAMNIVDSPSRRQLVENIQRGDAAVWLFLESGNTERDEKQYQVLKKQINSLSEEMKLAESATDVAGNPLDIKVINSGVNFSLIRIKKDDPEEEIFRNILTNTEADLKFFKNVPLAFPVFGQGRALYALAGYGIKDNNIETACNTIIGWCSCTIKDDNPGIDLLIKADWESIIGDSSWIKKVEVPEITGLSGFIPEENEVKEKISESGVEEKPVAIPVEEDQAEQKEIKVNDVIKVVEPVGENINEINNKMKPESQSGFNTPLIRNSLIAVFLLLIIIASSVFFIKRK